jgi:hypothetical protein
MLFGLERLGERGALSHPAGARIGSAVVRQANG